MTVHAMISVAPTRLSGPAPDDAYPMPGISQMVFLRHFVDHPDISVGDYTLYDGSQSPRSFQNNVLFLEPGRGDRLIIGRFCHIGAGVRFLMNGANQALDRLSTYPFHLFGKGWEASASERAQEPHHGDTLVGHDVYIGADSLIMPGVTIGDGAVIYPRAVIHHDIPPYAVVMGNPALVHRMRFDANIIRRLLLLGWWDWPADRITGALEAIRSGDIDWLEQCAHG